MKKSYFPILCGVWPYLFAVTVLLFGTGFLSELDSAIRVYTIAGIGAASVILGLVSFAFGMKEADIPAQILAKWALSIKLAHIPFYIAVFLLFLFVPLGAALFFCVDLMAMFCSLGFGLSSVLRCRRAGLIGNWECVVCFLMNLFFVTDVIAAILLRRKTTSI